MHRRLATFAALALAGAALVATAAGEAGAGGATPAAAPSAGRSGAALPGGATPAASPSAGRSGAALPGGATPAASPSAGRSGAALPGGATPAAPPTADAIVARARTLGVGDQAQRLTERFLPGARLLAGGSGAVGSTRIGGRPDLPRGARWPRCGRRTLSFLMQVDLAELAAAVPGATRAGGTLWVFADLHERPDGITRVELTYGRVRPGGCVRVQVRDAAGLVRRATPRGTRTLLHTPVVLRPTLTVPGWEAAGVLGGDLTDRQLDSWFELADEAALGVLGAKPDYQPLHQLLGWAQPVQAEPTLGCGDGRADGSLRRRRLLLQLDFDPELRFAFGDGGALYVTMPESDLRAGRFNRLCAEFQQG